MANENKKDFNTMMRNNKDMPKIQVVEDEKTIKKYGGTKMFFAPPIYYDELMKKVPKGKLIIVSQMREYLAKQNNADFTDLRGSYATKILKNGIEIRDVADLLGHKNIETTENFYISSTEDSRKYATEIFDNISRSETIDKIIKYKIDS